MISAAFPYQKQRRRVLGREMAYVEVGAGDTLLAGVHAWVCSLPPCSGVCARAGCREVASQDRHAVSDRRHCLGLRSIHTDTYRTHAPIAHAMRRPPEKSPF